MQGGQAHAEEQSRPEAAEQLEILPGQRAAGQDADVQRGVIADKFKRAPNQEPGVRGQFPPPHRVGVMDDLVRIGGAAKHHRARTIGLELRERSGQIVDLAQGRPIVALACHRGPP